MSICCIVMCGARRTKNQPQLTFHRFPKNEALRRKWLEAIGSENINPRLKNLLICSLHFEEKCFNRTLDVVRLRDYSLPTIFPFRQSAIQDKFVLVETSNTRDVIASTSAAPVLCPLLVPEGEPKKQSAIQDKFELVETSNTRDVIASTSAAPVLCPLLVPDGEQKKQSAIQDKFVLVETSNTRHAVASTSAAPVLCPLLVPDGEQKKQSAIQDKFVLVETSNTRHAVASTSAAPVLCPLLVPDGEQKKQSAIQDKFVLVETSNTRHAVASTSAAPVLCPLLVPDGEQKKQSAIQDKFVLVETSNTRHAVASTSAAPVFSPYSVPHAVQKEVAECNKIKILKHKCLEQKKKIKRLNEKLRRKDKKIANLNDIIQELQRKSQINNEQAVIIEDLAGPQDFLKRQVLKSRGLPLPNKYSEEIRKFAITLHFLSPKAYKYVREKYNTCLPHTRTLCKWYQHVNAEPGFTKEAFDTLKMKVQMSLHPIICSLVFDEMSIRKSLIWDSRAQKYYGRVDYGFSLDNDAADEASQVLVIILTSINGSWKIPIGYFLITSLTGEQKSVLIDTALKLCDDVGVKVVSITCDGPAANFSMFASLGCEVLKNQEETHFERGNTLVHIFIDPCHALKLIRNAFGELRIFIDSFGRKIDFKYVEDLLELQEKKGLYLANKIKKQHVLFQKQKMKVNLATQLFSSSVADAIDYCRTKLKLKQFEGCEGTVNFINILNDLFDVLNSHSIRPPGFKKAMCPSNIGFIKALFENASGHIKNLKLPSGELVINSRRKTGFIAMLINMNSALALYTYLVEDAKILKYIPLYKISQDHIELFFSAVRARGGFNNNPNAVQFRAAYKKLLVRAEIRDDGIGNCAPLEQINILTCTSTNPISALKELTKKENFSQIAEDDSDLYDMYMESILVSNDVYTDRVLEYISGFVTKKLLRNIKCEACVSLLLGEEDVDSLIYKKSRGGLKYAAYSVIEIIKNTEKLLKIHFNEKYAPEKYYLYIFKFLCEICDLENYFSADTDPDHCSEHKLLLIKSVIKIFLDLRFKYYGKSKFDNLSHRQFFNKLTLFRNE